MSRPATAPPPWSATLRERWAGHLDHLLWWGLLGLVALAPAACWNSLLDHAQLPKNLVLQISALSLLAIWFARQSLHPRPRVARSPLDFPLLLLLGWALLSAIWASDRYGTFLLWAQWAAAAILYFLTRQLLASGSASRASPFLRSRVLLHVIAASGASMAALGIGQYLLGWDFIRTGNQAAATFANKNIAAQFYALAHPLLLASVFLARSRLGLALASAGLTAVWTCLFYTFTKAAWAAAGVQLLAFTALAWKSGVLSLRLVPSSTHSRPPSPSDPGHQDRSSVPPAAPLALRTRSLALGMAIAVTLILIHLTPQGWRWRLPEAFSVFRGVAQTYTGQTDSSEADPLVQYGRGSLAARRDLWGNSLHLFLENPSTGVGLNNFYVHYVDTNSRSRLDPQITWKRNAERAHHDLLQIAAELGLPGLALALLLAFLPFFTSPLPLRSLPSGPPFSALAWIRAGALASWAGLLVNAGLDFPLYLPIPVFIAALLAALLQAHRNPPEPPPRSSLAVFRQLIYTVVTIGLLLVTTRFQYRRAHADAAIRQEILAWRKGDYPSARQHAGKALTWDPWRLQALNYLAEIDLVEGRWEEARQSFERFLEVYPHNLENLRRLAYAHLFLEQWSAAETVLQRALLLEPEEPDLLALRGNFFLRQKRPAEAYADFRRASWRVPLDASPHRLAAQAALAARHPALAARSLREVIALDPADGTSQVQLGILEIDHLGQPQTGRQRLRQALATPLPESQRTLALRYLSVPPS